MFSNLSSSSISLATVTPSLVPEALLQDHVPALGAQGYFYGVSQDIDPLQERLPGFLVITDFFRCHLFIPPLLIPLWIH
jgi:hypothetical protein